MDRLLPLLQSKRIDAVPTIVASHEEFLAASLEDKTISFVTDDRLQKLEGLELAQPIVVISDEPLATVVPLLAKHPWMSHAMNGAMLEHPLAEQHLSHVVKACALNVRPKLLEWVGSEVGGRRVRLIHASRRAERIERMTDFFAAKGVGDRTTEHLRDIAEELLTNAFYDAPAAAGAFPRPVSRVEDVTLPEECACDLAYGARKDFSFVRIKDVFGSLSRRRVVEVLGRCARTDMKVEVDESMGGAGLGLWRVFSVATFVSVSVVKDRYTEILVGIAKKEVGSARPYAFDLFFEKSTKRKLWGGLDKETSQATVNRSVIIGTDSK